MARDTPDALPNSVVTESADGEGRKKRIRKMTAVAAAAAPAASKLKFSRISYSCPKCKGTYDSWPSHREHVLSAHGLLVKKGCVSCDKSFIKTYDLNKHRAVTHSGEKKEGKKMVYFYTKASAAPMVTPSRPVVCLPPPEFYELPPNGFPKVRLSDEQILLLKKLRKRRHVRFCPLCQERHSGKKERMNHMRSMHAYLCRYECPECGSCHTNRWHLRCHQKKKHPEKNNSFEFNVVYQKQEREEKEEKEQVQLVNVKKEVIQEEEELQQDGSKLLWEEEAITGGQDEIIARFTCYLCNAAFFDLKSVSKHFDIHHPDDVYQYQETVTYQEGEEAEYFRFHENKVKIEDDDDEEEEVVVLPYLCGLCGHEARNVRTLLAHLSRAHKFVTRMECPRCPPGITYADERGLKRHFLKKHKKIKYEFVPEVVGKGEFVQVT